MICNRCLVKFETNLRPRFTLTYTRRQSADIEPADDEEVELQEEKIGLIPFAGQEIDLLKDVQSEIVMAIPMQPVCSKQCRGLCPQCGGNLNETTCSCKDQNVDPRLAVLKNLKIDGS